MIDEYQENGLVCTSDDFLRCRECRSTELTMNTTSMSHGIVHDKDGVVCEFTCNKCRTELTLALYNHDVGNSQLTARINWVQKVVPYVPTAIDKLKVNYSRFNFLLKENPDLIHYSEGIQVVAWGKETITG